MRILAAAQRLTDDPDRAIVWFRHQRTADYDTQTALDLHGARIADASWRPGRPAGRRLRASWSASSTLPWGPFLELGAAFRGLMSIIRRSQRCDATPRPASPRADLQAPCSPERGLLRRRLDPDAIEVTA